jgi:hypothetical protein
VSEIAGRRKVEHNLCNTAMQFFKVKLTHSLFYNHLFYAQLISVHTDKRCVFKVNIRAFLSLVALNQPVLTPAVQLYFFADVSHILIMFRHDFGEGGGCHGHHDCVRSVVGSLSLS